MKLFSLFSLFSLLPLALLAAPAASAPAASPANDVPVSTVSINLQLRDGFLVAMHEPGVELDERGTTLVKRLPYYMDWVPTSVCWTCVTARAGAYGIGTSLGQMGRLQRDVPFSKDAKWNRRGLLSGWMPVFNTVLAACKASCDATNTYVTEMGSHVEAQDWQWWSYILSPVNYAELVPN
ncbi:hypothetical protein K491DRAFT_683111 [Lophiostoma macrostomum CBS 122681]|uniref:Uncharacterized protein n=1 Tax=Lophiostoma macrostomum CBS 122681 TaxID=1314788 RepID=A0A6A6SUL9_9PLEO|nr:hypothetical protein K491DRAFT_683111 [Lophiostoma macrostomum CBS 122681]